MIVHVALFAWKEGVDQGEVAGVLEEARALRDAVPGVIDVRAGENFSSLGEGLTHGVVVLADDREAYEEYRVHPAHRALAERIARIHARSLTFNVDDASQPALVIR